MPTSALSTTVDPFRKKDLSVVRASDSKRIPSQGCTLRLPLLPTTVSCPSKCVPCVLQQRRICTGAPVSVSRAKAAVSSTFPSFCVLLELADLSTSLCSEIHEI